MKNMIVNYKFMIRLCQLSLDLLVYVLSLSFIFIFTRRFCFASFAHSKVDRVEKNIWMEKKLE